MGAKRRTKSTGGGTPQADPSGDDSAPTRNSNANVDHDHDHGENHPHTHSHSHSIFGHSHSHGEERDDGLVEALKGGVADRGSRITLIGLASNVALTASKGTAGWYLNSASLLADAGHSLSDMLGDIVTLFCWKLSRRPPNPQYPYGFGKYETLGTSFVSLILVAGALGIGFHSYTLLLDSLSHTVAHMPAGQLQTALANATSAAQSLPGLETLSHAHGHSHGNVLDPTAAWFAGGCIIAKEWLYRATKKVAEEERSSVLLANAIHHRSDAYTSFVALVAILGGWMFPSLPLDPIGGLLVSVIILSQTFGVLRGSFRELMDAGVSSQTLNILNRSLTPLLPSSRNPASSTTLLAIRELRAKRAGTLMFVDLTADVPRHLSIVDASTLEAEIRRRLVAARKEISDVRVKFQPVDS